MLFNLRKKASSKGSDSERSSVVSRYDFNRSNTSSIRSGHSSSRDSNNRHDSITSPQATSSNPGKAPATDFATNAPPAKNPARFSITRLILSPVPVTNPLQTLATITLEHLATSARYGYPLASNQKQWRKLMRTKELQASYAQFLKTIWACGELFAGLLTRTVEDGWTRLERVRRLRARIRGLIDAVDLAQVEVDASPAALKAERERAKSELRNVLKSEREGLLRDLDVLADMQLRLQELLPLMGNGITALEDFRDGEMSARIVEPDRRSYRMVVHESIITWRRARIELTALKNAMAAPGEGIPTLRRLNETETPLSGTATPPPEHEAEEEAFTQAWCKAELGGTPRYPLDATALLAPGLGMSSKKPSGSSSTAQLIRPFDELVKAWIKWFMEEWVKSTKSELILESSFGIQMEDAFRCEDKGRRLTRLLRKDSRLSDVSRSRSVSPQLQSTSYESLPRETASQKGWAMSITAPTSISH